MAARHPRQHDRGAQGSEWRIRAKNLGPADRAAQRGFAIRPAEPACRKYVALATDLILCRAPKQRSCCHCAGERFGGVMRRSASAHYESTDAEEPTGTFRISRP